MEEEIKWEECTITEPDTLVVLVWDGWDKLINVRFTLSTPNAGLIIRGLVFGKDDRKGKINLQIIHNAPHTKSDVKIKGLLTGQSRVDFRGLTRIEHGAKNSNAWLESRFLILSNQAKGMAIPSLEILDSDIVKAGHAATAGKIGEVEMFYMLSRGLTIKQGKELLIKGFIKDVLKDITYQSAREKINYELRRFDYA